MCETANAKAGPPLLLVTTLFSYSLMQSDKPDNLKFSSLHVLSGPQRCSGPTQCKVSLTAALGIGHFRVPLLLPSSLFLVYIPFTGIFLTARSFIP